MKRASAAVVDESPTKRPRAATDAQSRTVDAGTVSPPAKDKSEPPAVPAKHVRDDDAAVVAPPHKRARVDVLSEVAAIIAPRLRANFRFQGLSNTSRVCHHTIFVGY